MIDNLVYFDVFDDELESPNSANLPYFRMAESGFSANIASSSLTSGNPGYTGGNQPFTLEFWVRNNVGGDDGVLFRAQSNSDLNNQNILIRLSVAGQFQVAINGGANIITESLTTVNTLFNHFALTFNGVSTYTLFLNGVQRGQATGQPAPTNYADLSFSLGSPKGAANFTRRASFDEIRFWNVALTDKQIKDRNQKRIAIGDGLSPSEASNLIWMIRPAGGLSTFTNLGSSGADGNLVLNTSTTSLFTTRQIGFYKTKFKGRFANWTTSTITKEINFGDSAGSIRVASQAFDDFGEGDIVKSGNKVKINVFNRNNPNGFVVYQGKIDDYDTSITGRGDSLGLYLVSDVAQFYEQQARAFQGTYNIAFSVSIREMFREFLNRFRSWNKTSIYYTDSSIPNISPLTTVRTINGTGKTWGQVINTIYQMLPVDWFYRIESDGLFVVKEISSTPDHIFTIGYNILSIDRDVRTSMTVNEYLGYNRDPGEPGAFATRRGNVLSQIKYGVKNQVIRDNRFENIGSMNAYLDRKLAVSGNEIEPFTIEISSSATDKRGYPIETIKQGDTFAINGYIDQRVRLITKVDYMFDKVIIYSQDLRDFIHRKTKEIENRVDEIEFGNPPISY